MARRKTCCSDQCQALDKPLINICVSGDEGKAQGGEMRPREGNELPQDHTAGKWQSQDRSPGSLAPHRLSSLLMNQPSPDLESGPGHGGCSGHCAPLLSCRHLRSESRPGNHLMQHKWKLFRQPRRPRIAVAELYPSPACETKLHEGKGNEATWWGAGGIQARAAR